MDRVLSLRKDRQETNKQPHLPVLRPKNSYDSKPFSSLSLWVAKSVKNVCCKAKNSNGFTGMLVNNSVYCASPYFLEEKMEALVEKSEEMEEIKEGFNVNENLVDGVEEDCRESSSCSNYLASEITVNEELSSFEGYSSPPSIKSTVSDVFEELEKPQVDSRKFEKQGSTFSEIEMMKERFSKLLLGEDMSGCGNGVCTALAISNAITNLCATLFGQIWRLEPLSQEKRSMWQREMAWLLCVSDHIVELIPNWQTFPDGSKLEVMTCRPRSDLYSNLPALRKLDNLLLEILDSFESTEFWYVEQGIWAPEADASSSFKKPFPRQEKWWLPIPRVPTGGLSENARKQLQHKRDCTNQILKASMAINSITLAEMEVPESFLEGLPKNGRSSLGDLIYRYITSNQFSPDCLLDCIDLSSEHQALEIANRVEASVYVWRRKMNLKSLNSIKRSNSKSSWVMVKELVSDADKRELLADRAESLLLCLKQRFPGLPQTSLDMSKIQYNKDVGKSILEGYSRVLESLAFNIVARIDDLLYVDDLTKHSDKFLPISTTGVMTHKSVGVSYKEPTPSTPNVTAFTTPHFSPTQLARPAKGEMSSFVKGSALPNHGLGVKKVLTDYLSIDTKGNNYGNQLGRSSSCSNAVREASSGPQASVEFSGSRSSKEAVSYELSGSVGKKEPEN